MRHRLRAGLIHLSLSAAIAAAVFFPIYFLWYPDVLFESAGGRELFLLIVGVDVTLGPLITTLVYVPGKRGLLFDLVVIGVLQLGALACGVYVLFESRPVYIVFVKDRFELVRANQFPAGELEKSAPKGYDGLSWSGPKIVAARMPDNVKEQLDIMMSGIAGVDVHLYPRYYVPYEEMKGTARGKGEALQKLRDRNPARANEVGALVSSSGRAEGELRFLPMRAGKTDLSIVIDAASGEILKISSLKPWGDI
ncbi:MAG TPA: TfpX/TfpZ family type IV pilin accessory protein [Usitatibacter sp.]|nr:TfpX/TfpZ family type IV pilin accessory protein [Usitatibacter sp.]